MVTARCEENNAHDNEHDDEAASGDERGDEDDRRW